MKIRFLHLAMAIFVSILIAFSAEAQKPDEMGKITCKLLKSINKWNEKTYEKHMLSAKEVFERIGNRTDKSEPSKEEVARWNKDLKKKFAKVCEDGEVENINWKKIKYNNFTFEPQKMGKTTVYEGDLYFLHNHKKYKIEVGFLITDKGLRLGNLEDLKEVQ